MKKIGLGVAALLLFAAAPSYAADNAPCGANMVCASDPQSVVRALQKAGYKAELSKDARGDPKINSAANGYDFVVYFYDCKDNVHCAALQFSVQFVDDGKNTPELANKWNKNKRFVQMAVTDDDDLTISYDVTTLGGLNQANFADVVDWWQTMLGELRRFFQEQG